MTCKVSQMKKPLAERGFFVPRSNLHQCFIIVPMRIQDVKGNYKRLAPCARISVKKSERGPEMGRRNGEYFTLAPVSAVREGRKPQAVVSEGLTLNSAKFQNPGNATVVDPSITPVSWSVGRISQTAQSGS